MTYLDPLLDRLAAFEPTTLPVLSLYLNTSSDQHGRDDYASFLRRELKAAGTTFPLRSSERTSFERDTERITTYPAMNQGRMEPTLMSKNNVNPNHYKVAGRERQGEDIAQARNKQKHAENLVRQRTEIGARFRKPAPQDGNASPDGGPTRSAKTAARKTRATPLQTPPGQKRGHNLVPGSSGSHARFPKAAPRAALRSRGAAQLNAKQATKRTSVNLQGADKRGKRSTAQKRASSRHEFDPMPATNAVAGAFGKEPSPRRLPMRK